MFQRKQSISKRLRPLFETFSYILNSISPLRLSIILGSSVNVLQHKYFNIDGVVILAFVVI